MSASRRVAISTPVVLSSKLMTVTNITASRSPTSHDIERQGKLASASACHGVISGAAICGCNSQPLP